MKYKLRKMDFEDLNQVLEWRNHYDIRSYMFNQEKIASTEHVKWFENNCNSQLQYMYIYEAQGVSMGFVQLKRKNIDTSVYEWGFYTSPDTEKGTGTVMLKLAIKVAFSELKAHKIYAEVLAFNERSVKLHQRLGFTQEGHLREHHLVDETYHDVLCFGLLSS